MRRLDKLIYSLLGCMVGLTLSYLVLLVLFDQVRFSSFWFLFLMLPWILLVGASGMVIMMKEKQRLRGEMNE